MKRIRAYGGRGQCANRCLDIRGQPKEARFAFGGVAICVNCYMTFAANRRRTVKQVFLLAARWRYLYRRYEAWMGAAGRRGASPPASDSRKRRTA